MRHPRKSGSPENTYRVGGSLNKKKRQKSRLRERGEILRGGESDPGKKKKTSHAVRSAARRTTTEVFGSRLQQCCVVKRHGQGIISTG